MSEFYAPLSKAFFIYQADYEKMRVKHKMNISNSQMRWLEWKNAGIKKRRLWTKILKNQEKEKESDAINNINYINKYFIMSKSEKIPNTSDSKIKSLCELLSSIAICYDKTQNIQVAFNNKLIG